jgi:hypothetical protein
MMVSVITLRNLPTLVPPYFWMTQPASGGLPMRGGELDEEPDEEDMAVGVLGKRLRK